ncbi:MAG: HAD domain-containing protein [Bacteroidia bacterium]
MLILLDIDGVMVTTPPWKNIENLDDEFSMFNNRASSNLQHLLSETSASIVLTTSHKSRFNSDEWMRIFQRRGIRPKAIRTLAENMQHLSRKEEILKWRASSSETDFVIIDDDKSLHDLPPEIKKRCVITSNLIGLNEEATTAALAILQHKKT